MSVTSVDKDLEALTMTITADLDATVERAWQSRDVKVRTRDADMVAFIRHPVGRGACDGADGGGEHALDRGAPGEPHRQSYSSG